MTIREMWRRMTATRYTRALEAEVARQGAEIIRQGAEIGRLRGENRALLNSILGIAGIPPIPVDSADVARGLGAIPRDPRDASANDIHSGVAPDDRAAAQTGHPPGRTAPLRNRTDRDRSMGKPQVTPPMRRRSWQQITRMLELESARKTVASD